MTVDKFGHYFNQKHNRSKEKRKHLLRNFGFTLDGNNISVENRRIINLAAPLDELDAVNKSYMDTQVTKKYNKLNSPFMNKIEERLYKIEENISKCYETEKIKKQYDIQLSIMNSDIKRLQEQLTKNTENNLEIIDKAVKEVIYNENITKAIKEQLYNANEDFIKTIDERFNKLNDYVFKLLDVNSKAGSFEEKYKYYSE